MRLLQGFLVAYTAAGHNERILGRVKGILTGTGWASSSGRCRDGGADGGSSDGGDGSGSRGADAGEGGIMADGGGEDGEEASVPCREWRIVCTGTAGAGSL